MTGKQMMEREQQILDSLIQEFNRLAKENREMREAFKKMANVNLSPDVFTREYVIQNFVNPAILYTRP